VFVGCFFFEKLFDGAAACSHWISSIKDIDNDIGGIDDLMLIPIPTEKKKRKRYLVQFIPYPFTLAFREHSLSSSLNPIYSLSICLLLFLFFKGFVLGGCCANEIC